MAILRPLLNHKLLTLTAILLISGGVWFYRSRQVGTEPPRYVTVVVAKGTLVVAVTGSGQVSAANQVDVKPKVSGDVVSVNAKQGQSVQAGAILVQLDSSTAQKAVRDAQANLESAQIALEKLKKPTDSLTVLQSQNALLSAQDALTNAQESKQEAQDNLKKGYDDGFTDVSNAFLDFPDIMAGLQDVLHGSAYSPGQTNTDYIVSAVDQYDYSIRKYRDDAVNKYNQARKGYDTNFVDYKGTTRTSDATLITRLIQQTYATAQSIAEAVKSNNNFIQFYKDKLTERNIKPAAIADTHLSNLNSYTGKMNTHLATLLASQKTLTDNTQAIVTADRTIREKTDAIRERTESLAKVQQGPDALDIQSQQLTIKQRQNALADARALLADYVVRAPFDGVVATMDIQRGNTASASTIIATLVTRQKIAEVSLNEVDVAKIKSGQKSTLSFDAIEGLNITGEVAQVDTIGTVSQGVVTYTVKIGFDTQDDRVKTGMSVSAAIVTDLKQDVLVVPSSAVKAQGAVHLVQVFNPPLPNSQGTQGVISATPPSSVDVEVGLSNDTSTEIITGLKEGDQVVVRTIMASTATTSATPSLFGGGGTRGAVGGGTGGAFRAGAR